LHQTISFSKSSSQLISLIIKSLIFFHLIGDGWSKDAFFEGQFTPKKAVQPINVFLFLERDEQAAKRASAHVKAEKRKQKKRAFREWKTESLLIVRDNRQITSKYEQPVPTTAYPELAFPPEVFSLFSLTLNRPDDLPTLCFLDLPLTPSLTHDLYYILLPYTGYTKYHRHWKDA